jgi:hypothetical protein
MLETCNTHAMSCSDYLVNKANKIPGILASTPELESGLVELIETRQADASLELTALLCDADPR